MEIKYLTYILAIAQKKNMTKAAEELYVSQSSLSQYLSKLEQEIGTPLFYRAKGELTLTPAGELYVKAAEDVIKIRKRLYQNIANLEKGGHINVGVTSNFALRILSEIIPQYKKKFPDISIEISEISLPMLKKMVVEENLDLGIIASTSVAPFEGQSEILRNEEILFAIPIDHPYHQINASDPIKASDLTENFASDNFCMSKKGSSLRMVTENFFDGYGFEPVTTCETNSISTIRNMVANYHNVAFISESCSHDRDRIAYYSLEPKLYRLNMVVRRKNWVMNEPEEIFWSLITNYFQINKEKPYLA